MTTEVYQRLRQEAAEMYDIEAMEALASAVKGARVVWPESYMDAVYVTVDGKRQVVKARQGCTGHGFDLWVPRRKPEKGGPVTCSDFNCTIAQAVAFLEGATLKSIREMEGAV